MGAENRDDGDSGIDYNFRVPDALLYLIQSRQGLMTFRTGDTKDDPDSALSGLGSG